MGDEVQIFQEKTAEELAPQKTKTNQTILVQTGICQKKKKNYFPFILSMFVAQYKIKHLSYN